MKSTLLACLLFAPFSLVLGQIVTTLAGIPDSVGTTDGALQEATFNNPHGIAIGPEGSIFIADRFSHTIRKITMSGEVSTIAGSPGMSGDSDGFGSNARFYEPWGITVDTFGNVYVADTRNNKIKKIEVNGYVSSYAGTGAYGITNGTNNVATFGFPSGIEADIEGDVYVADHNTHIIRKISKEGQVSTVAGIPYILGDIDGPANEATFNRPYGLTLDEAGNIYVADEWNHKIRKISVDGNVTTIAGTGSEGSANGPGAEARFRFPWDVTLDAEGNIYVADGTNYAIRKIVPGEDNLVSTYAGNIGIAGSIDGLGSNASFVSATGIAYSPQLQEIFVADAYNDIIRRLTDVNMPPTITLEEGALLDCPEAQVGFSVSPPVYELYEFYIDDQLVELSNTPYFDTLNLPQGDHTIKVVPYYDLIPIRSEEVEIERYEVVPAAIYPQSSLIFFEGDSVALSASEGIEYFWSTGEDTRDITVSSSQALTVEVVDTNGCMDISEPVETEAVPIPEEIVVEVDGPSQFCLSQNIKLRTNYGGILNWYKDGWPIEEAYGPEYLPTMSGFYQVEHTMDNGLKIRSDSVEVTIIESPILDFYTEKNIVRPGDFISLQSTSQQVTNIQWTIQGADYLQVYLEDNPSIRLLEPGSYDVILIGENGSTGCRDTLINKDYLKVLSESEVEDDVFVPNIFTPNNDGKNDVLYARGGDLEIMEFLVFSKDGRLVFSTRSRDIGWDGRINGKEPETGNFTYILKYTNRFGTLKKQTGKVILHN